MTIDERLERLTERHEALAQSVEMLLTAVRENGETVTKLGETVTKLTSVVEIDAENIRALARIADIHERRITRLEDQRDEGGR